MGHHSYLVVGEYQFLYTRDHYNEELAALFNESDRELVVADVGDGTRDDDWGEREITLGYYTTANALRQRLSVQGFTSCRALADLAEGVTQWRKTYDGQSGLREREARGEQLYQTLARRPREPAELLAAIGEAIGPHRPYTSFATAEKYVQYEDEFTETAADVEDLRWFVEGRSLVRLLVDQAPDHMRVGLDLSGLTGCCVGLDTDQPIAGPTRERQLAALPDNAPLIVLTEGSTDSRVLPEAMHVTHPHLVGFVRFIDYTGTKARGSVGALAIMVNAFIAAGVANRFVAIADNDAGAHEAFAKLKRQKLPPGCRVRHYPDLPLLARYPTVEPASSTVSLTDVNGAAGSLEMYLGEDVLTIDGTLAPVHLKAFIPAVQRHQGGLSEAHKVLVLKAFEKKVKAARSGQRDTGDWSGVHAIIEEIVHAFD
ncbi:HEPN/Toprim-associated domain-containing protein [Streptomyces graminilatus]|uniref:HEPN/Toprim-associated domain-containing protein n=1 Tax=Streptomyces graminilatus TaxID=1464070 RepID=UPI0006E293E1|nr:HEPN/Toprim-associated domain-containing protein [Streptomyces graminilatus]